MFTALRDSSPTLAYTSIRAENAVAPPVRMREQYPPVAMTEHEAEEQRIRAVYAERARRDEDARYALWQPSALRVRAAQLDHLACALADEALVPLGDRRVLEIGCGVGQWLVDLETMGARRENLAAVEIDAARLAVARRRLAEVRDEHGRVLSAGADLREASAAQLPWADGRFHVVLQSTVFTSILDRQLQRAIAGEMMRVTADDGCIVWYDFRYDNPWNKDVRGVGKGAIEALFPGWRARYRSVTLAPPLGRRVAALSATLARALEGLRVLNTHYLVTLRREGRG